MSLRSIGCPDCQKLTGGDCGKHGPMFFPSTPISPLPEQQTGWICPKCGRVYSPNKECCDFCNSSFGSWVHVGPVNPVNCLRNGNCDGCQENQD